MPFTSITRGDEYHVVALRLANGRTPALEFLDALPVSDRRRMAALIEVAAQDGVLRNTSLSKHVEGESFFEFRASAQRMFWCYAPGKRIVLLRGYTKKSARIPRIELRAARELYAAAQAEMRLL